MQIDHRQRRRALGASLVGTTLEWYDYMIFGQAAALVFPILFFTNVDPVAGVLSSFATFAVGFIARPIGAVIFGYFGDRYGRRNVLLVTLFMMGLSTFAIGLLPTFAQVGLLAPALLVLCRIFQGLAIGGEWGGAVLLAVEQAPTGGKKGFLGSIPQAGDPIGILLAGGAFYLTTTLLDNEAFLSWGWRLPFLAGILILGVGIWMRFRVTETPEFVARMKEVEPDRAPLISVLRRQPVNFLLSVGCRLGVDVSFYVFTVFAITYADSTGVIPRESILVATMVAAAIAVFSTPYFGFLADRVGPRKTVVMGLIGVAVGAAIFFPLLNTGSTFWASVGMTVGFAIAGMAVWAPYAGLLSEVFDPKIRYTGVSFSFQFSGIIGGGIAPFIAVALFEGFGSIIPVVLYVVVAAVISIVCVTLVRLHRPAPLQPASSEPETV